MITMVRLKLQKNCNLVLFKSKNGLLGKKQVRGRAKETINAFWALEPFKMQI